MPKNPNKHRVKASTVTQVTWVKSSTPSGRGSCMIRMKAVKTPKSQHCRSSSSPIKHTGSKSKDLFEETQPGGDDDYLQYEEIRPFCPLHKNVCLVSMCHMITNAILRQQMIISVNSLVIKMNFFDQCWIWRLYQFQGNVLSVMQTAYTDVPIASESLCFALDVVGSNIKSILSIG